MTQKTAPFIRVPAGIDLGLDAPPSLERRAQKHMSSTQQQQRAAKHPFKKPSLPPFSCCGGGGGGRGGGDGARSKLVSSIDCQICEATCRVKCLINNLFQWGVCYQRCKSDNCNDWCR